MHISLTHQIQKFFPRKDNFPLAPIQKTVLLSQRNYLSDTALIITYSFPISQCFETVFLFLFIFYTLCTKALNQK